MDFISRLTFLTFSKKDVIDEHFLDEEFDRVLDEFDKEYRFKDVNDLSYPDREIKINLLYGATELWKKVVNASHSLYKKIQLLESDYIEVKSQLDDKLKYELEILNTKRQEIQEEIVNVNTELADYHKQRKDIEAQYHKVGESKTLRGSLNRLSGFWFLLIMGIAGIAELFMYKSVFMSQEIGLVADRPAQDKQMVEWMAIGMASGFTVMIIWLAHKLGELLRHFDSVLESEKWIQIGKIAFISIVVGAAVYATVDIRGDMHKILAKDQQVQQLKNSIEKDANPFTDKTESEDEGFGGDGFGEDEMQESQTTKTTKQEQIQSIRDEVNEDKGATAKLFFIINIFIIVGGVFLSYETHTSSKIYETIEKHLAKLEKLKKTLEKELRSLDKEIIRFKNKKINKLFKELLLKAALYDKEVRTYNTYMQVFELKMQIFEDYFINRYEEKGVEFTPVSYLDVLDGKINIDFREELYHVKNIQEYMIYNKLGENNV